jgi:hypothetical protein
MTSEELVRLNRRGLGTGLLRSRILAAALLLLAAAAGILLRGSRTLSASGPAQLPGFDSHPALANPGGAALNTYAHLPLIFEANQGQTDARVKFLVRGSGYGLFLTGDEAVLTLHRGVGKNPAKEPMEADKASVVRMTLVGGKTDPEMQGTDLLPGKSNYLIGNDPSRWRHEVPQYARVRYSQVYPGVDLIYYGKQGELEYDFEVAPGADAKNIQVQFEGSKRLALDGGDLVLETDEGNLRFQAPHIYQGKKGAEKAVDGRFVLLAKDRVGFEVGPYDRGQALVIDPVLSYSTYLGGSGSEVFPTVAVDSAFDIYVSGSTSSVDFPVTSGVYQGTLKGGAQANVFIAKFDPTGATLMYSTYLGGTGLDTSAGIAADAAGNVYVAGTTTSSDFPTQNGFAATPKAPGTHAFVSELDSAGATLKYSTYLSGSQTDTTSGMTLDVKGLVYVIGITNSPDFPLAPSAGTLQGSLRGANAFFVAQINPATTGTNSLVFSSYFGGGNPPNGTVAGGGIAVDNNPAGSNIYITGGTNFLYTGANATTDFPIANAFQSCLDTPPPIMAAPCPTNVTAMDAFVAKINPGKINQSTGSQLLYNTYIGGPGDDIAYGIGLDASGNPYITGSTNSPSTNPNQAPNNPFPPCTAGGPNHATISADCINRATPTIGLQPCLNSPTGTSGNCPNTNTTNTDAFVAKINNPVQGVTSTNLALTYWSFLGGSLDDVGTAIAVDGIQGARVVGNTVSTDLPVLNAIQSALSGPQDAFAARLDTLTGSSSSGTTTNQFVTYLGGSGTDSATGIALDSNTNAYITGVTNSTDFPRVAPYQGTLKGPQDAFLAKLSPKLAFTLMATQPGSTSVNAGNQASFLYQVANTGDTTASVGFQDNLGGGSGTAPATFVSASVPGGTCPTTPTNNTLLCNLGIINGGAPPVTVTINVTPTGPGTLSNSGTLLVVGSSFSLTKAALPVTVNSFTLSALPTVPVVVAGQPASYQITLTPNTTFTANIALACSAGLPGGTPAPTCTFSTTPVALAGSSPSTVTLTISTTARTTTTVQARPPRGPFYAASLYTTWLPVSGLAFVGVGIGSHVRGKRRVLAALGLMIVVMLLLLQPACGGSSSSTTTTGTPAGTYTISITGTSGTFSQTVPITLIVQ